MKGYKWVIIGVFAAVLLPRLIWEWSEQHASGVVILDKTVPEDRREHRGITWFFQHYRYTGIENESDYYGYVPENKETRPLPENLGDARYIYVADTYGVYEENSKKPQMIYGGLKEKEWETIKRHTAEKETALIMEFNTIASPTEKMVQKDVAAFLHVQPTGWTGRWFEDLSPANPELSSALISQYEEKGVKWNFTGAGFVLIHEDSGRVIVLSEREGDLSGEGISLEFTEKGQKLTGLKKSSAYRYWFDINTPVYEKEEVLANYKWGLSEKGKSRLKKAGVPSFFPAVFHHTFGSSDIVYFAGDYADIHEASPIYRYAGFAKMRAAITPDFIFPDEAFYWKTYVPMMKSLLALNEADGEKEKKKSSAAKENGLSYTFKISGDRFDVYKNGKWESLTVKGVNLGMGKPGAFPGEAAITEKEYYRWLIQIGEMNANTIRVYTIHPPGFYQALKRYNEEHPDKPIYLFHGVWIDEAPLEKTLDAFTPAITKEFQHEMKTVADVIHGKADIKKHTGHASGIYRADISPYVIGWMIGIEWHPHMVDKMAKKHEGMNNFEGRFVKTKQANPMEIWLAQQLDVLMQYEADTYSWARPVSFTNWPSTDLLTHPAEPSEQEDLAEVNPNHIVKKQGPGMFASYHVYPYYPDFLNLEETYLQYKDHRGAPNNYAGYLHELKAAHDMPVLIAEFGIPASRGMTHENAFGWNQGFMTEKQQGEALVHLYDDILAEGMMGGLIFTWQDEWFKRTWNTMELDDPEKRPYWSNAQTNEQQFGLMSFDRLKVKTDGKTEDWEEIQPFYKSNGQPIEKLFVTHDERYLYVRMDAKKAFTKKTPLLFFDVNPSLGSKKPEPAKGLAFHQSDIDFIAAFDDKKSGKLLVDAYYDIFLYQYGSQLGLLKQKPEKNSDVFYPIRLALNKAATRPDTNQKLPFKSYETGKLLFGNSNPEAKTYHSLADYYYDEKKGVFEIRIPWLLLNVKDPSALKAAGDFFTEGIEASTAIEGIGIAAALIGEDDKIVQTVPAAENGLIEKAKLYKWTKWNEPHYEERVKQSYEIVKDRFAEKDN